MRPLTKTEETIMKMPVYGVQLVVGIILFFAWAIILVIRGERLEVVSVYAKIIQSRLEQEQDRRQRVTQELFDADEKGLMAFLQLSEILSYAVVWVLVIKILF